MRHGSPDFHADPLGAFSWEVPRRVPRFYWWNPFVASPVACNAWASKRPRADGHGTSGEIPPVVGGKSRGFFGIFTPEPLGKFDPIWRASFFFFQMGWELNHQLVNLVFCITLDLPPKPQGADASSPPGMTFFTVFRFGVPIPTLWWRVSILGPVGVDL